ncbi:MAG: anhydro-N-acetylmuramic acid kinase [Azospirillaceae bacterium]|nr:anhydro-N-acetylmuramic acid kinase [Azospirillaceae bacterium]
MFNALGLMSGTAQDGIDVALIRTDGLAQVESGGFLTVPYPAGFRERLRSCLGPPGTVPATVVAAVEAELTARHAVAVDSLLQQEGVDAATVDLVGFHGHTLFHAPEQGQTWQIGDGATLAARLGIAVINDFRSADVAAGGQGAPFVPLFHQALAAAAGLERPLAVLNIGGVANLTYLGAAEDELIACDTGPGNALLDDWMLRHTGQLYDADGAVAASGRVDEALVRLWLDHDYFRRPSPKSLDRDAFDVTALVGRAVADGAATLTEFTVRAIAAAAATLPVPPRRWLVTGGGRHNGHLMRRLADVLAAPVVPVEAVGWNGDALEAQAFAYLAVRSRSGLPLSLPATTGVARPMTGGRLHVPPAAPHS